MAARVFDQPRSRAGLVPGLEAALDLGGEGRPIARPEAEQILRRRNRLEVARAGEEVGIVGELAGGGAGDLRWA